MVRHGSLLLCLGFFLGLGPSSASGQEISVQVVASESEAPIPTAFVSVLDERGQPVAHALTNSEGQALFSLSGPGTYQLRAQMFGRATSFSPSVRVMADSTVSYRFDLEVAAIPLAGIRVASEQQCRIRPQDGREIARVWEEARTALAIQTWTQEAGLYRFKVLAWERDLDAEGQKVRSETLRDVSTEARNPIQSLPVELLMRDGFIQQIEKEGTHYFGPDASILLSNLFLDGHCFRLAEDENRPEVLGLAFEPVGDEIADVQGTLWLDRETAHLLFLEFDYVNVPEELTEGVAGGRVEFERLPDGTWIVRRWWIRLPIRGYTWIFGRKHLVGIHESGAVVSEIVPRQGAPAGGSGSTPRLEERDSPGGLRSPSPPSREGAGERRKDAISKRSRDG